MTPEAVLTTALQTVALPVYPIKLPKDATFPLITYQLVSAPRTQSQDRAVISVAAHYQIDCWGLNVTDARTTARGVADALLEIIQPALDIRSITIPNEQEFHEAAQDVYRRMLDVIIVYVPEEV
jgi:hypothetical protein